MPIVPPLNTSAYLDYAGVGEYLNSIAQAAPHLVNIRAIGRSVEGRDLLLAEVTNVGTGDAQGKPAVWIDANARGNQPVSTVAALAVLQRLAADYGRDGRITDLLDTKTFYIMPCVNPDAAEQFLSTGYCPGKESLSDWGAVHPQSVAGTCAQDIDGNGSILQMRAESPLGEWKVSKRDPRLLLPRSADDQQGPFYHLWSEGLLPTSGANAFAGNEGAFFEANFIKGVAQGYVCPRAVADFLVKADNVGAAVSFGGGRGCVEYLEPQGVSLFEQRVMNLFAEKAGEFTNLPVKALTGESGLGAWLCQERQAVWLGINVWNMLSTLGIEPQNGQLSENDYLAVLRWVDRECPDRGFASWNVCDHPQLGRVEVGGWDLRASWLNPPPGALLDDCCRGCVDFALYLAGALPQLGMVSCSEETVGWWSEDDNPHNVQPLRRVRLDLANSGFLPSLVLRSGLSPQVAARERGSLKVEVSISAPSELLMGKSVEEGPALDGTASALVRSGSPVVSLSERHHVFEWLVRGEGSLSFNVTSRQSGSLQVELAAGKSRLLLGSSLSGGVVVSQSRPQPAPSAPQPRAVASQPREVAPQPRVAAPAAPVAAESSSRVRPVNLTKVTHHEPAPQPQQDMPAAQPRQAASPVNKPKSAAQVMGGYRPAAKPGRQGSDVPASRGYQPQAAPRAASAQQPHYQPAASNYQPAHVEHQPVREESPLRKEAPATGRVFGQSVPHPAQGGRAPLGRPPGTAQRQQSFEDVPLPEALQTNRQSVDNPTPNVRPHSLIATKVNADGSDVVPASSPLPRQAPPPVPEGPKGPMLLRHRGDDQ